MLWHCEGRRPRSKAGEPSKVELRYCPLSPESQLPVSLAVMQADAYPHPQPHRTYSRTSITRSFLMLIITVTSTVTITITRGTHPTT